MQHQRAMAVEHAFWVSRGAGGIAKRRGRVLVELREGVDVLLAGDQIFVDLDLSLANLPPGTRLQIGSAVLRVSAEPHTGCKKFIARFGVDAQKFVNSVEGRKLNLRGINAHHQIETVFKAFGRALRMAVELDPRAAGTIPSTKGTL